MYHYYVKYLNRILKIGILSIPDSTKVTDTIQWLHIGIESYTYLKAESETMKENDSGIIPNDVLNSLQNLLEFPDKYSNLILQFKQYMML